MSARDLDTILLNIDWSANDWRDYDWDKIRDDLPTLRDETVHALARAHRRDGIDAISPIHEEQLRRLNLRSSPVPSPNARPVSTYFVNKDYIPEPETFTEDYGNPPPTGVFKGKKLVEPTFTVGIGIEVAIAAMPARGRTGDPHPSDKRALLTDPNDRHRYDPTLLDDMRDEVVRRLNASGVVTIARRSAEFHPRFPADHRAALIAETGTDPDNPEGSPTRQNLPIAVENEAQSYFATWMKDHGGRIHEASYTWEFIENCCNHVREAVLARGTFDAITAERISARFTALLKLEWFKGKRDDFHVYLPGMRPRYRAWSVRKWGSNVDNVSKVPWYRVKPTDYTPTPAGKDGSKPFPEEFYRFYYAKVSSPVMPMHLDALPALREKLKLVCKGLRDNFRIHKEMPSLELGTTICIGRTDGFTILELKKIATLWVALEKHFARLHRRHRYDRNGGEHAIFTGGAPILEYSRLWLGARFAADPSAAGYFPFTSVFNVVDPKSWEHLVEREMDFWVPPAWVDSLPRAEQLFMHAIWIHTDVSALSRALDTSNENQQLSFRLRCRGERRTGMPDRSDRPQTIEFRGMQASVDPSHILAWAMLCSDFVSFACAKDNREDYSSMFLDQTGILPRITTREVLEHFKQGFIRGNEFWEPTEPTVSWEDPFYSRMP
ncbi:hypothetical protein DL765_000662 [Monosporascus sp. GIB2]|nr:hypothetical protein DL765_000662 [Monosporascus sp. GIB2]